MSSSDFNKPQITDNYDSVLDEIKLNQADLARGLASDSTDPANHPDKSIRWNALNKLWERLSGSTWSALTDFYNIYVSRARKADECTGNAETASSAKDGGALAQVLSDLSGKFSNYLKIESGNITGLAPFLGFNEADQLGSGGMWRWIATSGKFILQRNTSQNRDYSSSHEPISVDYQGIVTFWSSPQFPSPNVDDSSQNAATTSWVKSLPKASYSWSEINNRPGNLSAFSNDSGYLTKSTGVSSINGQTGDISINTNTGIGFNQSWINVTSSRTSGTTYTNSTGAPIMVTVSGQYVSLYVGGVLVGSGGSATQGSVFSVSAIVPNGSSYLASGASKWSELR